MGKRKKQVTSRKSLADALFSKTKQKVLVILFGQPDRQFFGTEIITLAEKGSGAVQRELALLLEAGLITTVQIGKQKFYQANAKSPIFQELQSVLMKTVGLATPLQKALEKRKDIEHAFIFGSVAKGADRASSDIDLFVISDSLSLAELYELITPVERQIERQINCSLYNSTEFEQKIADRNPFIFKVLQGETIPLIGDQNVLSGKVKESR